MLEDRIPSKKKIRNFELFHNGVLVNLKELEGQRAEEEKRRKEKC